MLVNWKTKFEPTGEERLAVVRAPHSSNRSQRTLIIFWVRPNLSPLFQAI